MKKILFLFLTSILILTSFVYADSVSIPNPSEFNSTLRKIVYKNYWNYERYLPSSIVVVREKSNNSVYYYPTLSSSIVVDGKFLILDSPHLFYAFYLRDGVLTPAGGSSNRIDLDRYEILFITNAYTPDGQRLDNLGGGGSGPIGNDSWGDGINLDIDPNIPDFGFDKDNNNPNNSFFGSLVSYFKELISTFKKYFAFAAKVADRILTLFSDTYRLIKRLFDDFLKFSKFLVDFFNDKNFFEWLLKVFRRAFIVQPDYFKGKIDGLYKSVDSKITISNYKVLFTTLEYMKTQPFDDFSVRLYLFNSEINFVLIQGEFLTKAANYFRPFIGWFLYFFLGLYHFDQIYFLIRGTKYFNGKHTLTEMRK